MPLVLAVGVLILVEHRDNLSGCLRPSAQLLQDLFVPQQPAKIQMQTPMPSKVDLSSFKLVISQASSPDCKPA